MRKIILICLCGLFLFVLTGCRTKEGMFVPFLGTSYDTHYLQTLRDKRTEEPLYDVVIEDDAAAIKLYGSVDAAETFESYFSDDIEGGKEFDKWWRSPLKGFRSPEEIISIVKHGLRRSQENKRFMLRWLQDHFSQVGASASKYRLEAFDLMYYASFSPDKEIRYEAIYFGIKQGWLYPKVRKRYLQLSIELFEEVEATIKIAKTNESYRNEMLMYLQPYLNSQKEDVRQRAVLFEKFFKGEIDYNKWCDNRDIEKAKEVIKGSSE